MDVAAYGTPGPAQGTTRLQGWTFTSAFDGGNALPSSWKRELPDPPGPGQPPQEKPPDDIPMFSCEIARDCHGDKKAEKPKAFWFYFGVTPAVPSYKGEARFWFYNMSEQRDLFATGYRPWVSSPSRPRWQRLPPEADVEMGSSGSPMGWQCKWKYEFDGTPGMTRFAFCHPYGYSDIMAWLDRLEADFCQPALQNAEGQSLTCAVEEGQAAEENGHGGRENGKTDKTTNEINFQPPERHLPVGQDEDSTSMANGQENKTIIHYFASRDWHDDDVAYAGSNVYFHRQTVVRTPQGRCVDVLTVTEAMEVEHLERDELPEVLAKALRASSKEGKPLQESPFRFPLRPIVWFSGRVHPGETPGQFAVNGFLQFILSDDPRAAELRRRFVFKVCPMLNPDGVAWGHSRTNTLGFDLNRCYRAPVQEQHEAVFAVKTLLVGWAASRDLLFYMDSHGHAARRGCFFFGNHQGAQPWSSEDALLWNMGFVHLAQLNSPHVDLDACEWSRQVDPPKKKGQAQVEDDGDMDDTSRADSGRAQIGAACRLYHAYTLECNYNISRMVRPVPDAPGLPPSRQHPPLDGELQDSDTKRAGWGKRPKPMPYKPRDWASVGEAIAIALLDMHGLNVHSRLLESLPPKPLLAPEADLARASGRLEHFFMTLRERHRWAQGAPRPPEIDWHKETTTGIMKWVVVESVVYVLPRMDPTQTAKDKLASKGKGEVVEGRAVRFEGFRWLRLERKEESGSSEGYILIDGRALGVDRYFLSPIFDENWMRRQVWRVVHDPHVYIRSKPHKEGNALGVRKKGETVAVAEIRMDGWVVLDRSEVDKLPRKGGGEAYMLVDGSQVGLSQLMQETEESAWIRASTYCDGGVPARFAPSVEEVAMGMYPAWYRP